MEKKLSDYIHFHLGCDVKHNKRFVGKLHPYRNDDKHISIHAVICNENFKLALRQLNDIKNFEYDEWASFIPDNLHSDKIEAGGRIKLAAKQTAYLLSKHFDLFDLIPAGLALDAKTIKSNKHENC